MSQLQNALLMNKIVAIASNKSIFIDFIREFNSFFKMPPNDIKNILQEIESFRLLLSNKQFIFSANSLVQLEKELGNLTDQSDLSKVFDLLKNSDILKVFNNELDEVLELLGNNFLDMTENITIERELILDVEDRLMKLYSKVDNSLKDDVQAILADINKMKLDPFYDLMLGYVKETEKFAHKYNKKINPIQFTCDKDILVPPTFKKLTKSLMHVFINCLEHGIEKPSLRLDKGKDECGTIRCNVVLTSNILMIEIEDDGVGINVEHLSKLAVEKGIKTQEEIDSMFDDELSMLIFEEGISLKNDKKISSGVGMSTIKKFVDELGGCLSVDSMAEKGSKLVFTIPIHYGLDNLSHCDDDVINSIVLQTQVFLEDSSDIEFYTTENVDSFELRDDNCYLEMRGDFEGKIVFSFSKDIISSICSSMLQGMDEELIVQMEGEIINEIVNTIAGLAIQNFPKSRENTAISVPFGFNQVSINEDIASASKTIIKNIFTSHGKISCMLLEH